MEALELRLEQILQPQRYIGILARVIAHTLEIHFGDGKLILAFSAQVLVRRVAMIEVLQAQ